MVGLSALACRVPHFYPIHGDYLLQIHPVPLGRKGVGEKEESKAQAGLNSDSLKPWSYST